MIKKITNKNLSDILEDLDAMAVHAPALALFNEQKIKDFQKRNHFQIAQVKKAIGKIVDQYVMKDHNGSPVTVQEENNKIDYVFETDELRKQYLQELNTIMQQEFQVNY